MGTRLGTALPEAAPALSCPRSVRPPGWPSGDAEEKPPFRNVQHRSSGSQVLTADRSLLLPASLHCSLCAGLGRVHPRAARGHHGRGHHGRCRGPGPASPPGLGTQSVTSSGQGQRARGLAPLTHTLPVHVAGTRGQRAGRPCQPGSPFLLSPVSQTRSSWGRVLSEGECVLPESRCPALASRLGRRPPETSAQNSWGWSAACPAPGGTQGCVFSPGSCCSAPHASAALCRRSWVVHIQGRLAQRLRVSWPCLSCPFLPGE